MALADWWWAILLPSSVDHPLLARQLEALLILGARGRGPARTRDLFFARSMFFSRYFISFYRFLLNLDRGEAVQYMSRIRLFGGPRPWYGGAPENCNYNVVLARRKFIFFMRFCFSIFLKFFSSRIGSGPSGMAPWTPWIDIKIRKKFNKSTFWNFFSYWTLGQL